ncbi:MAG: hypothetical protein Kow0062_17580 [Acidobacteriota bacterium]
MVASRREDTLRTLAAAVVRLAALWLLAGGLFKLLWGSPADLPALLLELPLPPGLIYRVAVAVELGVALAALLMPLLVAPLVAAVFGVFCALLLVMAWRGDASCGCFGASVTIPPLAMLAIDGTLLVALLALRPWARRRKRARAVVVATLVVAVAAAVAPWALNRERTAPAAGDGASALPGYVVLDVASWIGRPLADTPLGRFLPPEDLPADGLVVLYRMTCEHCAEELFELAATDDGSRPITLVRIVDDGETEADHVVAVLPEGPHVRMLELPRGIDWVVTTPAELTLEDGVVADAREGGGM